MGECKDLIAQCHQCYQDDSIAITFRYNVMPSVVPPRDGVRGTGCGLGRDIFPGVISVPEPSAARS